MARRGDDRDSSHVVLRGSVLAPRRAAHRLMAVVALLVVVLATAGFGARTASAAPAQLKAVFIVGPAGNLTQQDLDDAEQLAELAESYNMKVVRIFHPHATWANVLANIQGANLVVYMGHGYGWPSPYPPFREKYQNGVGLDAYDGVGVSGKTDYHGGKAIRESWHLAPNAIVFLGHLCYAAGQSEPGNGVPTWDVARQRVDNMASAYLYAGAGAVFAYSLQPFETALTLLMTTNETVDDIFRTPGTQAHSFYGWVGNDPRYFDSVRTPGARSLIDPDPSSTYDYERSVTGDLALTAGQWRGELSGGWSAPAFQNNPPTPQGFGAQSTGFRTVKLTWQSVTVNYFGGPTYLVYRNGTKIAKVTGGTSYTDHLAKAGTYRYQVVAQDPVRAKSAFSTLVSVLVP
jgi:hypothetical protein